MMAALDMFDLELHETDSPEDAGSDDEFYAVNECQVGPKFPHFSLMVVCCATRPQPYVSSCVLALCCTAWFGMN